MRYGNNLSDEMLGCNLQVIVPTVADLRTLETMRGNRADDRPSKEPRPKR